MEFHDNKVYAQNVPYAFQDGYTPIMEGIINLHHDIFVWLIVIVLFILWMLSQTLYNFNNLSNKYSKEIDHDVAIKLEIIWTIIPIFILVSISIPSFALLYSMDEVIDSLITIKVIGYQWYWEYEYPEMDLEDVRGEQMVFQSYMINEEDLSLGELRLLEVDHRVVIPSNFHIRFIITAADVIHSWAVPSLGVKMDACPGRLNQVQIFCRKSGIYYGQCSEICGVNHGFMPIVVEVVPLSDFIDWYSKASNQ